MGLPKPTRRDVERVSRAFGATIRAVREEKGWSQEEFAHRARIHVTYLSGLERGRRNPTLNVIARLARALGVPLSRLFGQAGSE